MQDRDTNFGQDFVDINIEGTTEPFSSVSHIQVYRLPYLAVYPKFKKKQKVPWENGYCELTIIDIKKSQRSEL